MKRYSHKFDASRSALLDLLARAMPMVTRYFAIQQVLDSSHSLAEAELGEEPKAVGEGWEQRLQEYLSRKVDKAKEIREGARADMAALWDEFAAVLTESVQAHGRLEQARFDAAPRSGVEVDVPGPVLRALLFESEADFDTFAARLISPDAVYVMPLWQFSNVFRSVCHEQGKERVHEIIVRLGKVLEEWNGPGPDGDS